MTDTMVEEKVDLYEAAALAWEAKDKLDCDAARNSFLSQMFRKLKQSREKIDFDPEFFDDETEAHLRCGVLLDGITFCLDKQRSLSVVAWECDEKGCNKRARIEVSDLVSLGRALALGERERTMRPKCEQHAKRGIVR